MALCTSSKILEVKREVDVTEESPQLASHSDRVDFSESTAVSKVKVETDDVAETDSCCDPRELPRVKVESDIAAASVPSVSGCDRMDCYKSDPSHTSEVNIEIDVAEEIPQSWTVQDPMQNHRKEDPVGDNLTSSDTGGSPVEGSCSCGHQGKNKKAAKDTSGQRHRPPRLTDQEYDRLLELLLKPVSERAKTKDDDRLYRKAKRLRLASRKVLDPYRGEKVYRLMVQGTLILLPPREVDSCVSYYHNRAMDDGSGKLWDLIRNSYFGISRNRISQYLSTSESQCRKSPTFQTKAPLRPIAASQVMERHQIDLVDITSGGSRPGQKRYVLSVLDCFSRFLWLRSISDKRPSTIAQKLEEIYFNFGPPRILQSEQGNEFWREVERLCKEWNIRIIRSRPHHPGSHGKIKRSHRTWKQKIQAQIHCTEDRNWTKTLQHIAMNYNTGYHKSIKMSPYQCLFGVKSNLVTQAFAGGICEDVEEDVSSVSDHSASSCDEETSVTDGLTESLPRKKRKLHCDDACH